MAASRKFSKITIYFVDDGEGLMVANMIEAIMVVKATEGGLTVTTTKGYAQDYVHLGASAKTRIDDFVSDVAAFIDNQEPIN